MVTFTCLFCNIEKKRTAHSGKAMYCSHQCQANAKSRLKQEVFWNGNSVQLQRKTIRGYLSEARGYQCEVCNISEWNGSPITLQVDHIDGDASSDIPTNLRLICPNCHSQTNTFGGGNKGKGRKARGLSLG